LLSDDIDADRLVCNHNAVFTFVKILFSLAVDKAQIAHRVYLEPESLALTSLDELLFKELEFLFYPLKGFNVTSVQSV
jgi:hypothetical protein